ncbi:hypothetical protein AU15_05405 [Marinobacter salarius]|jgi:hypothetical protein|uniref:Uncharacterized protein n=1 Tax=Marinobacter salarius TaxID=1420917 RepID=W5YV99_9GAMM|nr:hypothetical protein AU15_05405 [Marinobacter salarius]
MERIAIDIHVFIGNGRSGISEALVVWPLGF